MKRRIAVAGALLLSVFLVACGGEKAAKDGDTDRKKSKTETTVDDKVTKDKADQAEAMRDVETEFGTLQYPEAYKDALVTEESKEDEIDTITFSADLEGQKYQLFQILICKDEGDSVGTVKDKNGTVRNVFVNMEELPDLSGLTQEQQDQVYAMQESVNTLIEKLEK